MEKRRQTLYEILNVQSSATLKEIKTAYRQKAIEYHPDNNREDNMKFCLEMMCMINEAFRVLSHPNLRELYDESLINEGRCDVHNEPERASVQTPVNQTETNIRKCRANSKQYNYYNMVDFDEVMQEEFIEWLGAFSYEYVIKAFNYFREYKNGDDSILERIYNSFEDILDQQKKVSKKKENHIKMR